MDPASLLDSAARLGGGPAVLCGPLALSYADLGDLARRIGEALRRSGARPGDRVAAVFPNCHNFLATYFASLSGGFVLVPLNLRLSPAETRAVLSHSGARALIGDPETARRLLEPAAPSAEGDDWIAGPLGADGRDVGAAPGGAAQLYYTSGTTGRPKGVILTLENLAAHAQMTLEELRFARSDVWLHAAPMFHLADAWAIWTVTAAAATHVILPRFEAAAAYDRIVSAGVTITNLVPTMLAALLEEVERRGRPLPSLRLLLSGGAPIAPSVVARIGRWLGCEYAQTYGLTETSPFLTFSLLDGEMKRLPEEEQTRRRARTGRPARGVELRVVRPSGSGGLEDIASDDQAIGEVVVRGPTVTPGYWRDPDATAEAFRGGWFHTGDLGTIDAGGWINLVDRIKDVIVSGGETVYSTEVENALYEHPAVQEAAVFGVPDDRWGEAVRAAVVLKEGLVTSPAELAAFCADRIARYKCPKAIELARALPKTGSGKIDKRTLREPFWRGKDRRIN